MLLIHLKQILKFLVPLLVVPAAVAESVKWVFEGQIWEIDTELESFFGADAVFSGSFELSLFEPYLADDPAGGQYFEGGVEEAEITLDRNHRALLKGIQGDGWPIVDLRVGSEADSVVFIIPLVAASADTDPGLVWLEMGLHGQLGSLFENPSEWPDWESEFAWDWGWFRLSFDSGQTGQRRVLEGGLDVFAMSVGELSAEARLELMSEVVSELALDLDERDSLIVDLRGQLAAAEERIAGLNRTLDRVWSEQDRLRAERDRLLEVSPVGDEELWIQRLAEKEAQLALLDEAHQHLQVDYERLQYAFEDADSERRRLRGEVEGLRDALEQERTLRRAAISNRTIPSHAEPDRDQTSSAAFRIVEHPVQLRAVGSSDPVSVDQLESHTAQDRSADLRPDPDQDEPRDIRQTMQRRRGPRGR